MASTVLVKDLLWRVSVLLGDTAPQFQRFPETELVMWLQDGENAIAKFLPFAAARIDAIKLVAGTKQSIDNIPQANIVPGDGIALTAPVYGTQLFSLTRNMGADGATPGKVISKTDRASLDDFDEDWHTTGKAGSPVVNYCYDERLPTVFFVSPGVPAAGGPFYAEAEYAALLRLIPNTGGVGTELYLKAGASAQAITIADRFADDLVNYVLARGQLKDSKFAEASKSQMYGQIFINSINAQVQALTGSNPNLKYLPGGTAP